MQDCDSSICCSVPIKVKNKLSEFNRIIALVKFSQTFPGALLCLLARNSLRVIVHRLIVWSLVAENIQIPIQ